MWGNRCVKRGCGGAVCGCGVSGGACVVVIVNRGGCVKKVLLWALIVVRPLPWCQGWQWERVSVVVEYVVMVVDVADVIVVGMLQLSRQKMS